MTLEAAKPKHRYVALDSLRGVCACMVALVHFESQSHFGELSFVHNGFLFVDFFFVLSGFVIGSSYGQRLSEGFPVSRFMWLRLGRVYPLHIFMLFVLLAFEIAFAALSHGGVGREPFSGNYSIGGFIASIFVVQIFVGPEGSWNLPAWSIAAEIWTYLSFALLLRYASRWIIAICLLIAVAALVVLPMVTDHYIAVFHQGAYLRCLYGFALGIVAWRIMPQVRALALGGPAVETMIEIAVVILVVGYVSVAGAGPLSMVAPFIFFIAVMVFAREGGALSGLLKTAPLILLGTLSYSIYMIHWFLLWRFVNGLSLAEKLSGGRVSLVAYAQGGGTNRVGGGPWISDLLTFAFLGIVIFLAYITYRLIELPGQRFARDRVRMPIGAALPAAPGAP